MKCKECYFITEIDGKLYTDCELYGVCCLGDEVYECPEEQLEKFKGGTE